MQLQFLSISNVHLIVRGSVKGCGAAILEARREPWIGTRWGVELLLLLLLLKRFAFVAALWDSCYRPISFRANFLWFVEFATMQILCNQAPPRSVNMACWARIAGHQGCGLLVCARVDGSRWRTLRGAILPLWCVKLSWQESCSNWCSSTWPDLLWGLGDCLYRGTSMLWSYQGMLTTQHPATQQHVDDNWWCWWWRWWSSSHSRR